MNPLPGYVPHHKSAKLYTLWASKLRSDMKLGPPAVGIVLERLASQAVHAGSLGASLFAPATYKALGMMTGYTESTIASALRALEALALIKKQPGKGPKPNVFTFPLFDAAAEAGVPFRLLKSWVQAARINAG